MIDGRKNGATVLQDRGSGLVDSRGMMTGTDPAFTAPAEAPRAGADLRAARERLGWELPEAAEYLRIRRLYLEALEAGRLSALPANAYALGFLRTYAAALGLAPDEMVRRFRAEAVEVSRKTELEFPAPVPERGLPAGAIMLLGIVLLAGAYAGWYRLSGEGRLPAETVAPVPERLAPLAQQAVPSVLAQAVPVQSATSPASPAPLAPSYEPSMAVPSVSPSSAAAAPVIPLPVIPPEIVPPPPADQVRVTIRATADAWIQVRDKGGAIILNRVLKPGETWQPPAKPGLSFTTGNAGGTEVVLDGTQVIALGGNGAVRRDLPLDPEMIKDGKLSPMTVAPAPAPRTQQ